MAKKTREERRQRADAIDDFFDRHSVKLSVGILVLVWAILALIS